MPTASPPSTHSSRPWKVEAPLLQKHSANKHCLSRMTSSVSNCVYSNAVARQRKLKQLASRVKPSNGSMVFTSSRVKESCSRRCSCFTYAICMKGNESFRQTAHIFAVKSIVFDTILAAVFCFASIAASLQVTIMHYLKT